MCVCIRRLKVLLIRMRKKQLEILTQRRRFLRDVPRVRARKRNHWQVDRERNGPMIVYTARA